MAIHNKEYDHEAAKKSLEKFLIVNPHVKKQLEKELNEFDWKKFNRDLQRKTPTSKVPPGIIAFSSNDTKYYLHSSDSYDTWVMDHVTKNSKVHTILHQGIFWNLNEVTTDGTIEKFDWSNAEGYLAEYTWFVHFKEGGNSFLDSDTKIWQKGKEIPSFEKEFKEVIEDYEKKRGWPSDDELQKYFLANGFWEFITWLKKKVS